MDALRCPPGDAPVAVISGGERRRVALTRLLLTSRTSCCWTSPPTTLTPNRSPGWNATCNSIKGTVIAVTHDRYFLDNVAGWILELDRGFGIPWKGQLLVLAGAKEGAPVERGKDGEQAPANPGTRAGVDSHVTQSATGEGQGARDTAYERC
jgi:ATPase subunit of ABC transporter with duplicated ATPase domains